MLSNIISILTTAIALISVIFSFIIFRMSQKDNSYLDIDKQYSTLLVIAMDDPDLRCHERTSLYHKLEKNDPFRMKYQIYAQMCWNLMETIYDKQKEKKGAFSISDTWLPVIQEENKLHYTWFRDNARFFKPDFQEFVLKKLNGLVMAAGTEKDLLNIFPVYEKNFPESERMDTARIKHLINKKEYILLLAKHPVFKKTIGYAFLLRNEKAETLWLDYIAIDAEFQNSGYGSLFLKKIMEQYNGKINGIFMEVEIPNDFNPNKRFDQERRVIFYERLGATKISVDYLFPSKEGALPMYLYFLPEPDLKILPKEVITESVTHAYNVLHSDIPDYQKILKQFIDAAADTELVKS